MLNLSCSTAKLIESQDSLLWERSQISFIPLMYNSPYSLDSNIPPHLQTIVLSVSSCKPTN